MVNLTGSRSNSCKSKPCEAEAEMNDERRREGGSLGFDQRDATTAKQRRWLLARHTYGRSAAVVAGQEVAGGGGGAVAALPGQKASRGGGDEPGSTNVSHVMRIAAERALLAVTKVQKVLWGAKTFSIRRGGVAVLGQEAGCGSFARGEAGGTGRTCIWRRPSGAGMGRGFMDAASTVRRLNARNRG